MAVHLPRESATMLAIYPRDEVELWAIDTHLLAAVVDLLAGANWQRAGKKTRPPKPLKRPTSKRSDAGTAAHGFDTVEDFREWYAAQPGGRQLNNN